MRVTAPDASIVDDDLVVSVCANPQCAKPFRYLHEGRLIRFEPETPEAQPNGTAELFWLCGECVQRFVLTKEAGTIMVAGAMATVSRQGGIYGRETDSRPRSQKGTKETNHARTRRDPPSSKAVA
jgi:hypothetical protein